MKAAAIKLKCTSTNYYRKDIDAAIEDLRNQIAQTSEETRRAELTTLLLEYQREYVSRSIRGPVIDTDNFTINQDATALEQYKRDYQLIEQNYSDLKFTRLQNMVLVERIDQPVTPENPVRPNLLINLVLGFAIGLLLAIIYISFRNNYGPG